MATKSDKRQVRGLVEGLEHRAHRGPPIRDMEIQSVRDFLRERDFSPASDYFDRLTHLEQRLQGRAGTGFQAPARRNYGGEAGGRLMQVQSAYDHLIISTCYDGAFNGKSGRIKISHRFNQAGRIDFVELKYLRSLHPLLNGSVRKLLLIREYQSIRKDWLEAEAAVLRILPQELIFLYESVFRSRREEILAWLVNIGHGIVGDALSDLQLRGLGCGAPSVTRPEPAWLDLEPAEDGRDLDRLSGIRNGNHCRPKPLNGDERPFRFEQRLAGKASANGDGNGLEDPLGQPAGRDSEQLSLSTLLHDEVALPILEKAAALEAVVEMASPAATTVRYVRRGR